MQNALHSHQHITHIYLASHNLKIWKIAFEDPFEVRRSIIMWQETNPMRATKHLQTAVFSCRLNQRDPEIDK